MEQITLIIIPLLIGYVLDLIFGDPRKLPHPIVGFGNSISFLTKLLNNGKNRLIKGAFMCLFLASSVFALFYFSSYLLLQIDQYAYLIFTSIFVFYGLANKSLLQEGVEVFHHLNTMGLEAGRKRLSWIVGRDTSQLSEQEIRLAVFETLSENLSDGVVAPLFYYAIGGVPGMMCYKMINTMDSMIGYKNEKFILFGRFAARLDDLVNFIPARITALLMALVTLNYRSLKFIFKYGKAHTSPNAGYPESALAGILNCRFGGAHDYGGKSVDKPFIGENDRLLKNEEINKIKYINHAVCFVSIVLISTCYLAWNGLF
ncbi:adenosylcobinamide-phosphate synthase CbiB [Marinifilum caeruleilacunae]|uniref:Cobalamin biosynthesis protein CobD n=1 Tax=Marinifilum caeruleilacunae TaxID=2499076 RepID=A0ABX1WQ80_9BACT|nr:adenosylcobinamide-phosphate synthase CbiB [Marinifilum caeruleilacunae]NOU58240.1 cobalamin biosynthesis protein CobD [Marinifilum caeruleilacunae]